MYKNHPKAVNGNIVELEILIKENEKGLKELKFLLVYNSRIQGRVVPSFYGDDIWQETRQVVDNLSKLFDELNSTGVRSSIDLTPVKGEKMHNKRLKYDVTDGKKVINSISMRRAVLESVKLYVQKNQDKDTNELLEKLNSTGLPTSSYQLIKEYSSFQRWYQNKNSDDPRYFINKQDRIFINKDKKEIVVCSQWTKETFDKYVFFMKENNITIS